MEASGLANATLTRCEVYLLSRPGWQPRLWFAATILVVLANLPPVIAGPVIWIVSMQYVMLAESLGRVLVGHRRARRWLEIERDENAAVLVERDAQIGLLMAALAQARSNSGARQETDEERTFRQVGLHLRAPEFLITAARRAYRAALHPDRHPNHLEEAHQRFLKAEAVFERIAELRR